MIYKATTPEEYLDALENDWRKEKLQQIRKLIIQEAPNLKEYINYSMLGYGDGKNDPLFHLNAQKNYVSLYVGDIVKVDADKEMLKGFNMGKGCIRVKKTLNLAETRLGEFIRQAVEIWENGGDTSC